MRVNRGISQVQPNVYYAHTQINASINTSNQYSVNVSFIHNSHNHAIRR